ncbi:histidine phosphatase family protein [Thalassospira sp.]|uniref:SixA phosphatase family protein n=1 Tax=Thalassospira sp. TaxID=1912094 RepID=UPI002734617E|nr:histidine phosphatase family protein [Thalassospira sp.]MDP2696849.1 histidine phosphatase family protein [Thalassospira sp.]
MKTLLLLRHAKSSWTEVGRSDHDRSLNGRGEKAAPVMGRFLQKNGLIPDLILCSTAQRAVQTLSLLGRDFARKANVVYNEDLYMADDRTLRDCLRQSPDEAATVLMIGHNPGLEDFAARLAGDGSNADRQAEMARKYPTAALAGFEFEIDQWRDIGWGQGRLTRFVRVRDLQES